MMVYQHESIEGVASALRVRAELLPPYTGNPQETGWIIERARVYHVPTESLVIFCRDAEMHACGWFKNPDWDRCRHLSLSFLTPTGHPKPHDHVVARQWVDALFRDDARYLWVESPFSDIGKRRQVYHYRVMCDPAWMPIVPRGEPYSKEFTERGWQSWSDQQAARAAAGRVLATGTPP